MQAAERVDDYLGMLNPAQRQAAEYGQNSPDDRFEAGPLLVIAGAGTGKTMTLAHRVAHLIIEGVAPERILLLTFTRRAAQTMTRRVDAIVRDALAGRKTVAIPAGVLPWSGTFHSIANRLLRRFAHNLGLDPGFSVLDRGDAADMIDVVRHELKLTICFPIRKSLYPFSKLAHFTDVTDGSTLEMLRSGIVLPFQNFREQLHIRIMVFSSQFWSNLI